MAVDAALVAAVRGLIWDPPRAAAGERLGVGDGRRVAFELAQAPVLPGTLRVWVASDEVTGTSTVDLALGLVTLVSPPAEGEVVEADYQYALLSDAAITSQLE
ncbi:MAG TPA: hypothetical protein VEI97_16920, partial [bacterium]|nr:hypothetical protein [bacterium]